MWSCMAALLLLAVVCRTVESILSSRQTEDYCQYVSTNGTTENTIHTLIQWQNDCRMTWLYSLNVTANTRFANATIPVFWLHLVDERSIHVQRLTIDLTHVAHIQRLAFATNIFGGSTDSLTLINFTPSVLTEQSLIGLNALQELRFESSAPLFIPACLCGVAHSVTTLYIGGPHRDSPSSINPLTATALARVAVLELSFNLRDTIDEHTFLGMSALAEIRLSHCHIEVIGPNTFYAVRRTLRLLMLNGNRLSRLPMGLLNTLLPNPRLFIAIHDNPWICDCRLYDLQMTLNMYAQSFELDPLCDSPAMFANRSVMSSEFCIPLQTTTTSIGQITVTETTEVTHHTVDPPAVWIECRDEDDENVQWFSMRRRDEHLTMAFSYFEERLEVRPQSASPIDYRVLIQRAHSGVLHSGQVLRQLNVCNVSAMAVFAVAGNSSKDVWQMICVQPLQMMDYQMPPFNCIAFNEQEHFRDIWISGGLKTKTLVMAYGIFLFTIALGCMLGYGLHNLLPGHTKRLDCEANRVEDGERTLHTDASTKGKTRAGSCSLSLSDDSLHHYESISDLSRFEIVRRELLRQQSLDAGRDGNLRRQQRSLRKTKSAVY